MNDGQARGSFSTHDMYANELISNYFLLNHERQCPKLTVTSLVNSQIFLKLLDWMTSFDNLKHSPKVLYMTS